MRPKPSVPQVLQTVSWALTPDRIVIETGEALACAGAAAKPGERVTIAIRPERAHLTKPTEGHLAGTIDEVVYVGTATLYQIRLGNNQRFALRQTNADGGERNLAIGASVGIQVPAAAVQVLRD